MPANFPAVDDHVVEPETGTEMIRGEIRLAMPAKPAHAQEQCDIAYVIRSDVARGYVASTELLTRVDHDADFATDACIRKDGIDPATGSRYLEEISFEVKHTQSERDLAERARMLIRRGVRRVFAIYVREEEGGAIEVGPVKEWLAGEERWLQLEPEAEIVDRCLVQPVKVRALLDGTEANNQVARALLAQNNPVLAEYRRQALKQREDELAVAHNRALKQRDDELAVAHNRALKQRDAAHARELAAQAERAILELCDVLAIAVTAERRARMDAMTGEELDALRSALRTGRRWPEEL